MIRQYDWMNQEYGIRVEVFNDPNSSRGPFFAKVSCGVTGRSLGGVEQCKDLDRAISGGKKHARKFYT